MKFGAIILVLATTLSIIIAITSAAVSENGRLQVSGNKIINKNGSQVHFEGMSFFWSNNDWGGENFYNSDMVGNLKSKLGVTIVRAAMGVEDPGGYLEDSSNKEKVETIVDAAIAQDLYVIIDWHSHHAELYPSQAEEFFRQMALKYANYDNIIYEVYNEPLQISWDDNIKPYAEGVIRAIREHDNKNIIVVGTPTWSQDVDKAADNPITGYSNIAYTLHFYAGTHGQYLREKGNYALDKGLALMVTEWGTVNANGDGVVSRDETWTWVNWMREKGISSCNWSVNDKSEGASLLNPNASVTGSDLENQLTASGQLVKEILKENCLNDGLSR
eukprot:Pgem_evm1s1635